MNPLDQKDKMQSCRISSCSKLKSKCDQHYCRPKIVCCGEPIKKKGDFCSKHACPICKISRFECIQHFCNNKNCLQKKYKEYAFCDMHLCKICLNQWPCTIHTCKVYGCKERMIESFDFCDKHSKKHLYNHQIPLHEYNKSLFDFWKYVPKEYNTHDIENYNVLKKRIIKYKFQNDFEEVVHQLHKNMNKIYSNDLLCTNYCSRGYCDCDLMPRIFSIKDSNFHDKLFICKNSDNELVYCISNKVPIDDDDYDYNSKPNYKAWTIPKIFLDDLDFVWDKTRDHIVKMIMFEYVDEL
jgi:hypothetical protein